MKPLKADPPGELLVMLFAIAIVLVGLTWYWRTPESGGGPQHGVVAPWTQ